MQAADVIGEVLADHQDGHTAFQMLDLVITANAATRYGMYRQTLREVNARFRGLENLLIDWVEAGTDAHNTAIRLTDRVRARIRLDRIFGKATRELRELNALLRLAKPLKEIFGSIDDSKREDLEARDRAALYTREFVMSRMGIPPQDRPVLCGLLSMAGDGEAPEAVGGLNAEMLSGLSIVTKPPLDEDIEPLTFQQAVALLIPSELEEHAAALMAPEGEGPPFPVTVEHSGMVTALVGGSSDEYDGGANDRMRVLGAEVDPSL